MEPDSHRIKIGTGLGDIKFGISREELKSLFGKPNEKEVYGAEEESEYLTETWHYDEQEFSVSFDEEDSWKLTTISTSSLESTIEEFKVIGISVEKVDQHFPHELYGSKEIESSTDQKESELIFFPDSNLTLWFEQDKLSEIQWCVFWEEDRPNWP